ncbi:hypothetical protein RHMOL_Rhmol13G0044700 [Rhododendron molle]|uniref:Uncharacterized protein n=1 Tax=Rhododendron molle TaxID=49168 RepID=A0ACC0L3U2_RHOML|nr:hypothetical protein RHMOL_Rhmol13G0044700 [Rhododendron molle]
MDLRDIGSSLPPGFRFYPSDEELVCHYLYKKIANEEVLKGTLVEIDLHKCEPWQLPEVAKLNSSEWYFFSFRDRKYATGFRTNRATASGYWKATGKDRTVHDPRTRALVGMRKTLVFYRNRAPNGIKTGWIMHEFRLENPHTPPKEDWVLCRVFQKSKGESNNSSSSNNELSPDHILENSNSPPDQTFPSPGHYQNITSFPPILTHQFQNPSTLYSSPASYPNFPHSYDQQDINNFLITEINAKCEDEYPFLFEGNFPGSSLADANFGEMRFDEDNSLVYL